MRGACKRVTSQHPRALALRNCSKMVEDEPPAQAPRRGSRLDTLSDDSSFAHVCARLMTHGTFRGLQTLKPSSFGRFGNSASVWAGGVRRGRRGGIGWPCDRRWMLSEGRWRSIPPMSVPAGCLLVIIDNEMWVMGGWMMTGPAGDGRGLQPQDRFVAVVHADEPAHCAVAGVVSGRLVVAGGDCDGYLSLPRPTLGPVDPAPAHAARCLCHGVRAERTALCDGRLGQPGCRCWRQRKRAVLVVQSRLRRSSGGKLRARRPDLGDGRPCER